MAEGNRLRARLARCVEATERLLENENTTDRQKRADMRATLEDAYTEFLEFKTSRSAWQDIHGADPGLLSTAKAQLDRLQ